ncbi:MAG: hypothetical protein AB7Q23_16940 [Hyphomonadaceae bacterium]
MRFLVAAALALAGAACQPPGYSDADREGYMSSCVASGGTEALCACAWDKIRTNIPRRQLEAFGNLPETDIAGHPITAQIAEYAEQCRAAGTQR